MFANNKYDVRSGYPSRLGQNYLVEKKVHGKIFKTGFVLRLMQCTQP